VEQRKARVVRETLIRHGNAVHCHAHSHNPQLAHAPDPLDHPHPARFPVRALLVRMMPGMAGSAALILLVLKTVSSPCPGALQTCASAVLPMCLPHGELTPPGPAQAVKTWTSPAIRGILSRSNASLARQGETQTTVRWALTAV
jgi:hypothetical protein